MANNASFGAIRGFDDPTQKSIEVRFASSQDRRLKYQAGVYALEVDVDGVGNSETAANRSWSANFYKSKTTSYAPFAQLTFSLTDTLRLVGGARYTMDKKETYSQRFTLRNTFGPDVVLPDTPPAVDANVVFNLALDESRKWTSTTYKAGLEWDVAPNSFAYVDIRSGFKAGGFFFGPPGNNSYDPEELTAYSLGIKNRFFGNRLQANFEAFLYDYTDQQLSVNLLLNGQQVVTTQNVGQSKIKGAELTLDLGHRLPNLLGGPEVHASRHVDILQHLRIFDHRLLPQLPQLLSGAGNDVEQANRSHQPIAGSAFVEKDDVTRLLAS